MYILELAVTPNPESELKTGADSESESIAPTPTLAFAKPKLVTPTPTPLRSNRSHRQLQYIPYISSQVLLTLYMLSILFNFNSRKGQYLVRTDSLTSTVLQIPDRRNEKKIQTNLKDMSRQFDKIVLKQAASGVKLYKLNTYLI